MGEDSVLMFAMTCRLRPELESEPYRVGTADDEESRVVVRGWFVPTTSLLLPKLLKGAYKPFLPPVTARTRQKMGHRLSVPSHLTPRDP